MKQLNIAMAVLASIAASAGIVEETKSQPVLVATAEIAPFGDVTRKVATLGTMINNPIVPTLILTSGQQQLVQSYGRFRADSPIMWFAYVQMPAWEIASTNSDQVAMDDMFESVVVYPSVDGPARMLLNHPGSTKDADGTIHLLPGENRPDDTYVRFTKDNRYCVFASSPAVAARAMSDFAGRYAARKMSPEMPLVNIEVFEPGMQALASLYESMSASQLSIFPQSETNDTGLVRKLSAGRGKSQLRRAQEVLRSISRATASFDIDDTGLAVDSRLQQKPGLKVPLFADFKLPSGAFDSIPAASHLFFFGGERLLMQYEDESAWRQSMAEVATTLRGLSKDGMKKHAAFISDIGAIVEEIARTMPFPDAADWSGGWLVFDAAKHPYVEQMETLAKADGKMAFSNRILGRLAAAFEKQWPGKKLMSHDGGGTSVIDWHALVDVAAAENGVKPGSEEAKGLEAVKRNIVTVLGAGKSELTVAKAGAAIRSRFAAPGVKFVSDSRPTGEARVAAVFPEAVTNRPSAVLYLSPYAFVRDDLLPVMVKAVDKSEAGQYKAMMSAMPPAEADGALAVGVWTAPDGGMRSVLRVTAGEIRNLGVAFNAFTSASLAGAADDD